MWPPFADLRTITGGLHTLQAGGDPFVDNPFDPWRRPLNYPAVWLTIFRSLGITDATVVWFGALLVVVFLTSVSCLIWRARAISELAALLACTLSFASFFVIERGNTDMAAFSLVMLGLLARPPIVVATALAAAAILKLFPCSAFVAAILPPGRWRRLLVGAAALATLVFLASRADELARIARATPATEVLSYGVVSGWMLIGNHARDVGLQSQTMLAVNVYFVLVVWAAAIGSVVAGWRRPPGVGRDDGWRARLCVGFGVIYAATFLVGSNWAYRLIFLIPTLPWMFRRVAPQAWRSPALAYGALVWFVMNVHALGHYGQVVGHLASAALACVLLFVVSGIARRPTPCREGV